MFFTEVRTELRVNWKKISGVRLLEGSKRMGSYHHFFFPGVDVRWTERPVSVIISLHGKNDDCLFHLREYWFSKSGLGVPKFRKSLFDVKRFFVGFTTTRSFNVVRVFLPHCKVVDEHYYYYGDGTFHRLTNTLCPCFKDGVKVVVFNKDLTWECLPLTIPVTRIPG